MIIRGAAVSDQIHMLVSAPPDIPSFSGLSGGAARRVFGLCVAKQLPSLDRSLWDEAFHGAASLPGFNDSPIRFLRRALRNRRSPHNVLEMTPLIDRCQ